MHKNPYCFWLSILCLATFSDLLVPVFLGLKFPGYNHLQDTISALGSPGSPTQRFARITLVAVGILLFFFAFGQATLFTKISWSTQWYTIGVLIFAVGCVLAGLFPETSPAMSETISGKIHGIASGIGFLFLILCPLWAVWIPDFVQYKPFNILLFVSGLITFLLFLISENIVRGVLQYTGLYQRINLIILYGSLLLNYSSLKTT